MVSALAGVVEERGEEEVAVIAAAVRAQVRGDVEGVAPVGERHPVEECELGRPSAIRRGRRAPSGHARPQVPDGLANLRPHQDI